MTWYKEALLVSRASFFTVAPEKATFPLALCWQWMQASSPLIVTLTLDADSFHYFDSLRQRYFPPAINHLSAHLTLFHHLPSTEEGVRMDLERWHLAQTPLHLKITEVKSIGRGVVFKIDCPPLLQLHKEMQLRWKQWLTPQDLQTLWPHITVQNKVSAAEAQQTCLQLQKSFQPFTATGVGFRLWSYEGGPWRFLQDFPFR